MAPKRIPYNIPFVTGREWHHIRTAIGRHHLSGDGRYTRKCHSWLEKETGCKRAFLTHSATGALEMAALLADIRPGDEVIMPSFTFVSTANAFVLRGAVPVFVDIREDTLNLDERKVEAAITRKTKAIAPVHYAGVGCEMDAIMAVAARHGLLVIEDAAQGICSAYKGRALGSIGQLAALSFHETKNIHCGEGGALLINDERFIERAAIIREKGTDRDKFHRGLVDKYTWIDIGSSYLPSEINAAFLWAQLDRAPEIIRRRLRTWKAYQRLIDRLGPSCGVRGPRPPAHCAHNGHIFPILMRDLPTRVKVETALRRSRIGAFFHYVPLHLSKGGRKHGRVSGSLGTTVWASERLLRLPIWVGMTDRQVARVVATVGSSLATGRPG